jgi:hypothetical protein
MTEDPDLTADQAWAEILEHLRIETMVQVAKRPLMAISGALGGIAARADGADTGGRPPEDLEDDTADDDLSWVDEVLDAA